MCSKYWSIQAYAARTNTNNVQEDDDGDDEGYIEGLDDPVWDADSFPTSLSRFTLDKHVTAVKQDWFTWADDVPVQVLTEAAYRVADAYSHFFTNIKENEEGKHKGGKSGRGVGFPKFKKKPDETWLPPDGTHITLPVPKVRKRQDFGLCANESVWIKLTKDRRVRRALKLMARGRVQIQTVTFSFSGGLCLTGASIRLRVDNRNKTQPILTPLTAQYEHRGGRVGIDFAFGDTFIVLSRAVPGLTDKDGVVPAPKHLLNHLGRLGNITQKLQRSQPGSRNHRALLTRFRKIHHTVTAERERWHHHVARVLMGVCDEIVREDLNIMALAKRKKGGRYSYGRAVADHAPGQFFHILSPTIQHQAGKHHRTIVVAHRWFPSSKTCSHIIPREDGQAVKATLPIWTRTHTCDMCVMNAGWC